MRRLLILMLLGASASYSQEPVVTLRATVTGNQEQPRVMYILPRQAAGGQGLRVCAGPCAGRRPVPRCGPG